MLEVYPALAKVAGKASAVPGPSCSPISRPPWCRARIVTMPPSVPLMALQYAARGPSLLHHTPLVPPAADFPGRSGWIYHFARGLGSRQGTGISRAALLSRLSCEPSASALCTITCSKCISYAHPETKVSIDPHSDTW